MRCAVTSDEGAPSALLVNAQPLATLAEFFDQPIDAADQDERVAKNFATHSAREAADPARLPGNHQA